MSLGSTKLRDAAAGTRRVVPRSRAAKSAPAHWTRTLLASPLLRPVRAHPGKAVAALVVSTLMTGIVGNAVWFQRGHHPAPLFGAPPPMGSTSNEAVGSVPLPVPRPPDLAAEAGPPAAPPPAAAAEAPNTVPVPAAPVAPLKQAAIPAKRKADGIGALLRDEASGGPKAPDATVLQAQRALAKLGYDVKPDGHLGAGTRKALEKFAAGRHLDGMTGPLSPKLLHDLALAAAKPRE